MLVAVSHPHLLEIAQSYKAPDSNSTTRTGLLKSFASGRVDPRLSGSVAVMTTAAQTSTSPSNTELVIGLVGALGSNLHGVAQTIRAKLTDLFNYDSAIVSVSGLMQNLDWERDLKPDGEDRRLKANMDAGRDLNLAWGPTWKQYDALASLHPRDCRRARTSEPRSG